VKSIPKPIKWLTNMKAEHPLFQFGMIVALVFLVTASSGLAAQQQTARVQRQAASAAAPDQLSATMQRQLEVESARLADPGCGNNCKPLPGATLKNPSDGGGLRYTCKGGNCACSGACQCVAMEDICMPDTIGCSDYGCSCKQKTGSEPIEPNC
jgi:hypothetical protein